MGNYINCKCYEKESPKQQQITFLQFDSLPEGMINFNSIKYLSPIELELFKFVAGPNIVGLNILLKNNNHINIADLNRTSLLHLSARLGEKSIVEELIKLGCNINLTDISGWTPMHIAIKYNRESIVKILLKEGANPYIKNRLNTTAYQLIQNEDIKQLATMKIIDQVYVQESIKKKDYRSLRDLYQKNKIKKLTDFETASIQQRVEQQYNEIYYEKILEDRITVLNLWFNFYKLHSLECSQNQLEYNQEILNFLVSKFPKSSILYILHIGVKRDQKQIAKFLYDNRSKLRNSLFQLLTNYELEENHNICEYFMTMLINQKQSLLKNIESVFSNIYVDQSISEINYFCCVFSKIYGQKQKLQIKQINAVHSLLFCLIINCLRKVYKINLYTFSLKKIIKSFGQVLKFSKSEISNLYQESQTSNIFKFIQKKQYNSKKIQVKQQLGYIYEINKQSIFISSINNFGIIFTKLENQRNEFVGIKIQKNKFSLFDRKFKFKDNYY